MADDSLATHDGDDVALVGGMAAGKPEAMAALYDRHSATMLGLAQRVLGDRRDAEDLLHDVFLEAWRKASRYDARRGGVRAWLLVMVRSRAVDRLRALAVMRKHLRSGDGEIPEDELPQIEVDLLRGVARRRALDAISSLPDSQREIVQLSCLEGFSCSEIAKRCGLPLGTVKSRLARALAALREQLGDEQAV